MGETISRFYYEYDQVVFQSTQNNSTSINEETVPEEDKTATMGVFMRSHCSNNNHQTTIPTTLSLQPKMTSKESSCVSARTTAVSSNIQHYDLPPLPWPQAPLLLRASRETTRVLGVRHAYTTTTTTTNDDDCSSFFASSSVDFLPINTGDEENPWAIDFESDLFRGIMMLRVKGASVVSDPSQQQQQQQQPLPARTDQNYFTGKQRKFQVLITGRFLRPNIRKSEILSGQILEQPIGKLPGLPIVAAVLKVYKTLQPKSHVELGNAQAPYAQALSPLVALAQTVLVLQDVSKHLLPTEEELQEPHPSDINSLFPDESLLDKTFSIEQRRKRRKKLVGAETNDQDDCFDMNKTYCFDMYQHQLNLTDYTLQLAMYRLPIAPVLNGQPLRILATVGDVKAWSFELWHESLLQ